MSRTYRCRHLPTVARSGGRRYAHKHVIDGSWRHSRWLSEAQAEEVLGPCPDRTIFMPNKGTHRVWVKDASRDYFGFLKHPPFGGYWEDRPGSYHLNEAYFEWQRQKDSLEFNRVVPVVSWHPYARHAHSGSRHVTQYKRDSNRILRAKARQACKEWVAGEEPEFAKNYEVFNTWNCC